MSKWPKLRKKCGSETRLFKLRFRKPALLTRQETM